MFLYQKKFIPPAVKSNLVIMIYFILYFKQENIIECH